MIELADPGISSPPVRFKLTGPAVGTWDRLWVRGRCGGITRWASQTSCARAPSPHSLFVPNVVTPRRARWVRQWYAGL